MITLLSLPTVVRKSGTISLLLLTLLIGVTGCGEDAPEGETEGVSATGQENWDIAEGIGPVHVYDMTLNVAQVAEVEGNEMVSDIIGSGDIRMRLVDSNDATNTWLAAMDFRMTGENAGVEMPVTNTKQRIRYILSKNGTVMDFAMRAGDPSLDKTLQRLLQSVTERQNAGNYFLRSTWRDREVGESWIETLADTIDVDSVAMEGSPLIGDFRMIFQIRTRYTYEGKIDTLGVEAIRIRSDIEEMAIDGSITSEAVSLTISSLGSGSYVTYFDAGAGIYLSTSGSQKLKSTIKIPAMGLDMPMNQTITMSSTRIAMRDEIADDPEENDEESANDDAEENNTDGNVQ